MGQTLLGLRKKEIGRDDHGYVMQVHAVDVLVADDLFEECEDAFEDIPMDIGQGQDEQVQYFNLKNDVGDV